jgi:hypothetical protein
MRRVRTAAALAGTAVGLALAQALPAAPPEAAVPVEQEPAHRVVFRNDYVIAILATIPAGETTGWHTHSHDGAAVRLTAGVVTDTVPGRSPGAPLHPRAGDVSVASRAKAPLTHRVGNVGQTTYEVADFEFLKRPDGPPTPAIAPPAAENETARVYRWDIPAGGATARHTHERPYVILAVTPMPLKMTGPDGSAMEHPVTAGDMHWVDARVTHTLANTGTSPGIIVEVELR